MMVAAAALRRLHVHEANTGQLQKSLERLSSGIRINKAADDAAGLAVSEGIHSQIRGDAQASANIQDGINYLQTAEGGLAAVIDVLHRMRELSVQAANDTYTDQDRAKIQEEIKVLRESLNTIPQQTEFNGIKPLILSDERVSKLATAPGTQADINLVIDGSMANGMQISYLQLMATFQAVQANLQARDLDLNMSITLSGYNSGVPIPIGNSTLTDDVDGTRLIVSGTSDQNLMKEWLFYTIGPAQFDTNPNFPFIPIINGPGRFNTLNDNYNALLQSSGVAGTDPVAGSSEGAGGVVPTANPADPNPPTPPGHATTTAYGTDAASRRAGVAFFQILLTNSAPGGPAAGNAAQTEASVAAALAADPDVNVIVGTAGGAGSAVAGAYDQIVTDTGGFFFDLNTTTPADFIALADQIQGLIPAVGSTEPTRVVWDYDTRLHIGANEGQVLQLVHPHLTAGTLGLEAADLSTQPQAEQLIGRVDEALKQVLAVRARLGAQQNRLEAAARNLGVSHENQSQNYSRIKDTDMAMEASKLTKHQVLQQATTALMAQAGSLEGSAWRLVAG